MITYSYIVAHDYGFAPNPFGGWCTLATCKPLIRRSGSIGDWIIGTGAKTRYNLSGHLIYAMCVQEAITFEKYWDDSRFILKRPVRNGSLKQIYGDNIYHKDRRSGLWIQADSHHSYEDGRPNAANITRDTRANRVLLSKKFVYYGENAPQVPSRFRSFGSAKEDLCAKGQGQIKLSPELSRAFVRWLEDRGEWGNRGDPLEFRHHIRKPC